MDLTPEALQNISVKVVSTYMLKQASLSEAIASEAKSLELNPEQIKRAIESSNTVAYLRQLEDAPNRSDLEFPVATYNDVMGRMVLPGQQSPTVEKIAESTAPLKNPLNADNTETQINSSITEQEKQAMLVKETLRLKSTLTKMAEDSYYIADQLEKKAQRFAQDPLAFEKLAYVADKTDLRLLVTLCKLDLTKEASEGSVFTNADLKEAITLNSLFKEAREMIADYREKGELIKRAGSIFDGKAGAPFEHLGNGLGWGAKKVAQGVAGTAKAAGSGINSTAKSFMDNSKGSMGVFKHDAAAAAQKAGFLSKLEGPANIVGSIVTGEATKHKYPVWDSIHG